MKKCNVLVTGAAGFIGQYLCEYLISCGMNVIGIDKRKVSANFDMICHDLTQPFPMQIQADVCVHLASSVGGILFNHSAAADMLEYNEAINRTVVDICKKNKCARLIFFSSINVFENDSSFAHESILIKPSVTPYAKSKAGGEKLYADLFDNFIAIRPTNVFGKRQTRTHGMVGESHVIPDLIDKINENEIVQVLGDGTQLRNFVHVMDVVRFVDKMIRVDGIHYFNLRSNLTITIAILAQQLAKALGKSVRFQFDSSYMKYETFQIINFDLAPAIKFGWNAEIHNLASGLQV